MTRAIDLQEKDMFSLFMICLHRTLLVVFMLASGKDL